MILADHVPRKVLVLGGGDGLLMRELLKYKGVDSILHIDLDPVLVKLATTDPVFRRANHDSYHDPRVKTVIGDGYQFIRHTKEKFDAIYIDFPDASTYDLAKLYSREFYEVLRKRIAPGGYATFDSTGTGRFDWANDEGERHMRATNNWPVYASTLMQAGYGDIVPFTSRLELDNPRARRMIERMHFQLPKSEQAEIDAESNPVVREKLRQQAHEKLVENLLQLQSVVNRQGFIFLTPDKRKLNYDFRRFGIKLHVLNAKRFKLAFPPELTLPKSINPAHVNSIIRPTLPVIPWWRPHTGY